MADCILAIDLGTSRIRAGLFNPSGELLAVSSREYPIRVPEPDAAEQDPAAWEEGFYGAVREVVAAQPGARIAGLAFSGQMHGTVLADEAGEPIRPAIIWCDQRGGPAVQSILDSVGKARYHAITANPLASGFQAATLRMLQDREPESLERAHTVFLPKDYLIHRVTGARISEPTDAVSTGLLHLGLSDDGGLRWSKIIAAAIHLPFETLPELTTSIRPRHNGEEVRLSARAAEQCGLPSGIPVLAAGGDSVIGANVIVESVGLNAAIGLVSSGGQLLVGRSQPLPGPDWGVHTLPGMEPGKWLSMAAFLAAGLSLEWWRGCIETAAGRPVQVEEILESAATAPSGSDGLMFIPHIAGERTPLVDPEARGSFLGIRKTHTLAHFARAVLEGVAMTFAGGLKTLDSTDHPIVSFSLGGGGVKSELWRQIFADVLQRPVHALEDVSETSLLGAGLAGATALGWDVAPWLSESGRVYEPESEAQKLFSSRVGYFKEMSFTLNLLRKQHDERGRGV